MSGVRVSPIDQPPVPPRKWTITAISEDAFNGYRVVIVRADSIMQAIEAFERDYGDRVRIVSAVRL